MEPAPFRGAPQEKSRDSPSLPRHDRLPRLKPPHTPRNPDRLVVASDRVPAAPPARSRSVSSSLADAQRLNKREVFKQMVVARLEAGFLRYSSRQALMDYAGQIGISQFDATLLIAEAQFYADRIDPLDAPLHRPHLAPAGDEDPSSDRETVLYRLMFAAAVALLIDLLVVHWLLG